MTLLIKNASLIDGSGSAPLKRDVLLSGAFISAVADSIPSHMADKVLDASGLCLAPGFIDTHGHSDISLLAAPSAEGRISQGITSEIGGNCGLSVFPVTDLNREHLQELYKNYNVDINWRGISDYAAFFDSVKPAVNFASLCGHNTLRAALCGYEKKEISSSALASCRALLESSLREGAAGFSTGLLYVPGKFADQNEISYIMKALGDSGKIYATHLRSESATLLESVDEAFSLCLASGTEKLHISHLKTAGKANWHKLPALLEKIKTAPLRVSADRYPFIESMTSLSVILPEPYASMDDVALQNLLQTESEFQALIAALSESEKDRDWDTVRLVSSSSPRFESYRGETIKSIAFSVSLEPVRVCAEILRESASSASAAFKGMSYENMLSILTQNYVCCGSDESARPLDYSMGRSHPRGFASMPLFFNILKNSLPLPEIIRRMTSLPANLFRLQGRGLVKAGYFADLLLFEPDKFMSKADFKNPHSPAEGIHKVFVNGRLSFDEDSYPERVGRFLKVF